ncbi:MAG: T9SS type A sorting domain-containing protein [Bacteroidia bacterium]|nr:T9SS type A sorting domain-containing protein [Bacteroidia bacterium]MBT8229233.1 T9SS type A sorting domain-containing protein [Bacteroidia bacterium]MBT8394145.1 T9SS type A sorting domain-containing protein [Bacteroidia bacterium]
MITYFVQTSLLLLFTISIIHGQNDNVYFESDPDYWYYQVEVIDEQMYLIENPKRNNNSARISLIDDTGFKLPIFSEEQFDGFRIYEIISIQKKDNNFLAITHFIDSNSSHHLGLMILSETLVVQEIRGLFPIRGTFVFIETQDNFWNHFENRNEWILGIKSNAEGHLLDIYRLYIDDQNALIHDGVKANFDVGIFFHAILNISEHAYLVSTGNNFVRLNQDFNIVNIYEIEVHYDNQIYKKEDCLLTHYDGDSVEFYTRKIPFTSPQFNLILANGVLTGRVVAANVVDENVLNNESSVYVLMRRYNSDDNSSFLMFSENLISPAHDSLKRAIVYHYGNVDFYKRRITIDEPESYIADIEYHNGKYYGCGVSIGSSFPNFYFIYDRNSDSISSNTDIEISIPVIEVYPNPGNGIIRIKGDLERIHSYNLTNLSGQLIYHSGNIESDLPFQLESGMYLLNLITHDHIYFSKKIIVY